MVCSLLVIPHKVRFVAHLLIWASHSINLYQESWLVSWQQNNITWFCHCHATQLVRFKPRLDSPSPMPNVSPEDYLASQCAFVIEGCLSWIFKSSLDCPILLSIALFNHNLFNTRQFETTHYSQSWLLTRPWPKINTFVYSWPYLRREKHVLTYCIRNQWDCVL